MGEPPGPASDPARPGLARPGPAGWWRLGRTLTGRAVFATVTAALVSVLVTALIAIPFSVRAVQNQKREALAAEAQLVAEVLRPRINAGRAVDEERIIERLRARNITAYLITAGQVDRPGLPDYVVARVADGVRVSGRRAIVDGRPSMVEGRPLPGAGGVVLAEPVATRLGLLVLSNLWLPLLAGLLAGVGAGVLLAQRLARPIRHAAMVATRLRAGDRRVRVPPEPPDEAADLAHALNDLAEALATSEGRQREFLLSVSHELRTPLTTIRGYAEALADGVVTDDAGQRAGRTMLAEAEHLDRLVRDLLALARLEAADFPIDPVRVDLVELVTGAAEAWRARCTAVGVELRTELPDGAVWAHTDPGRTRQILDGLLGNALRVVPPGAPVVLAAGAATTAGRAMVEVRDGGPGFTDDDLAVAFERGALHQRYRGVRKVGSGLGLAIAAGLARRLGGRIQARHAAEGGARFTVELPTEPAGGSLDRTRTLA